MELNLNLDTDKKEKSQSQSKSDSNSNSENLKEKEKEEKNNIEKHDQNSLNRDMFEFMTVIGKGGFGKVWKVQYKKTKEYFALKEMSKRKILDKKSEKSINSEMKFLSILNHPFIVNMHYAFQDNDNLYLVIDLLSGGDLRYHCSRYRTFSEEQTRFFIACITYSLKYIHENNVIHRDIKPENLVLDDKGYLRVTDFGIAKYNTADNSSETSGTPGYMSPEVMNSENHSFTADFFAIGVIGFEFLMGYRPYNGKNRKEIKDKIFSEKVIIKPEQRQKGAGAILCRKDERCLRAEKFHRRRSAGRAGRAENGGTRKRLPAILLPVISVRKKLLLQSRSAYSGAGNHAGDAEHGRG